MRLILALALVAALVSPARAVDSDGTRPDDTLTPGEIRTTDRTEICSTRTGAVRDVSVTAKVAARRAYGLTSPRAGWCAQGGCEADHRVPLLVGGGNSPGSIRNIWPQRPDGPFGYHLKDRCEDRVGHALCKGQISVSDAQAVFLGDWRKNCRRWLPDLPNVE